ncbi:MAG: LCP family protein [Treponema sp.]|nr:LCP family protein [Treponema sp.]
MRKKLRDEQKGILFIAIIAVIIISVSLFFALTLKSNSVEDELEKNQLIRILFVVDMESDDYNGNNEFLFSSVLIYDSTSHKAAVINLPDYTGAIYQSLGRVDKLAEVYNELGMATYKAEIEKMLGITLNYTSQIRLDDFIKLCDMMGGMRVFIPSPIDCVSENGERWLLPSGAVNLDGDKIATYLQYRDSEETEDNIQDRYQNVMVALLTGFHDKKFVIFNKKNFKKYAMCIQTNLDDDEEETLYSIISGLDAESIIRQTITGSLRNVDNQQLLFPLNNGEFIKEAIQQTTKMLVSSDGSFSARVYILEIQNGTTTQGLARRTSTLYQDASYNVLAAVNADRNDYAETVIIDHIGNETAARNVGELIRCTNIKQPDYNSESEMSSTEAQVDFTIILGKDFNGRYVIKGASY